MSEIRRPEPPAWNLTGKKYTVAAALHISLMDAYADATEAEVARLREQLATARAEVAEEEHLVPIPKGRSIRVQVAKPVRIECPDYADQEGPR